MSLEFYFDHSDLTLTTTRRPKKPAKIPLSLALEETMHHELKRYAEESGNTVTHLIRTAIKEFLEKE